MTLELTAINRTQHEAVLFYLAEDAEPVQYATLAPGGRHLQETFAGHRGLRRNKDAVASAELCMPADAATLLLHHGSALDHFVPPPQQPLADAFYSQQRLAGTSGLPVRASEVVSPKAVEAAAAIVSCMLQDCPAWLVARLRAAGCSIAVIGAQQKTRDIPEHRHLASTCLPPPPPPPPPPEALREVSASGCDCGCVPCIAELICTNLDSSVSEKLLRALQQLPAVTDSARAPARADAQPRSVDESTRGLGGTAAIPCTSVGEENLVALEDAPHYRDESILIHEFAHTVMLVGMDKSHRELVHRCYYDALRSRLYPADCYMGSCADEYWAEGTQSWFDATVRTDVNGGINTRDKLRQHDRALALLLASIYGDGAWRFTEHLSQKYREEWQRKHAPPPAPSGGACWQRLRQAAILSGLCTNLESRAG